MSDSETIAAIEIGTGKIQVFLGEIIDGKTLNFLGAGHAATKGVKKADILDIRNAAESAHDAIIKAESFSGAQALNVCLGISGTHIRGFQHSGSASVSAADGVVRRQDVEKACADAQNKSLAEGLSYISKICFGYEVDGEFCLDPVGRKGSRVSANYWMLYGNSEKIADAMHVVESFGLEIKHLVFSGIASALAATTPRQKEDGVLVADIGCGTTDYAYYKHGKIVRAGVVPVGGDHLTNDLSFGLRLSRKNAESIKTKCAKAVISEDERPKKFWISGDGQIGDRKVPLEAINKIVRARLEELFLILREEVSEFLCEDGIKEVVLTGGTSNLKGICMLASGVFDLPCSLGKFDESVTEKLRRQELSTALGLLEYYKKNTEEVALKQPRGFIGILKKTFL